MSTVCLYEHGLITAVLEYFSVRCVMFFMCSMVCGVKTRMCRAISAGSVSQCDVVLQDVQHTLRNAPSGVGNTSESSTQQCLNYRIRRGHVLIGTGSMPGAKSTRCPNSAAAAAPLLVCASLTVLVLPPAPSLRALSLAFPLSLLASTFPRHELHADDRY